MRVSLTLFLAGTLLTASVIANTALAQQRGYRTGGSGFGFHQQYSPYAVSRGIAGYGWNVRSSFFHSGNRYTANRGFGISLGRGFRERSYGGREFGSLKGYGSVPFNRGYNDSYGFSGGYGYEAFSSPVVPDGRRASFAPYPSEPALQSTLGIRPSPVGDPVLYVIKRRARKGLIDSSSVYVTEREGVRINAARRGSIGRTGKQYDRGLSTSRIINVTVD